jgi:hypothetical protein
MCLASSFLALHCLAYANFLSLPFLYSLICITYVHFIAYVPCLDYVPCPAYVPCLSLSCLASPCLTRQELRLLYTHYKREVPYLVLPRIGALMCLAFQRRIAFVQVPCFA